MLGVRWFIRFVLDPASRERLQEENREAAQQAAHRWAQTGVQSGGALSGNLGKGARDGTRRVQAEAGKLQGWFRSQFAQIGAMLAGVFAVGAVVRFGREVLKLGASGGEVASKFNTTFGSLQDNMNLFLDDFSRMAGLSRREGQEAAATFGAMAQGMGYTQEAAAELSKTALQAAGDLTSFNDVPLEQTMRAVRGAITGERESLKTLGVVITQVEVDTRALAMSGKDNAKALTQQDKAAASMAILMERMGPAAGDLVRTQDSLANASRAASGSWRSFKEVLGETIVAGGAAGSVVISLRNVFIDLTKWVTANQREIKVWSSGIIATVVAVFRTISNTIKLFKNAIEIAGNSIEIVLSGVSVAIVNVVNGAIEKINWLIQKANQVIPDQWDIPEIEFRADSSTAVANLRAVRFELAKNEEQARAALANMGDAWLDIYDAVKRAGAEQVKVIGDTTTAATEAVADLNAARIAALDAMDLRPRLEGKGRVGINKDVAGLRVTEVGAMAGGALEQREAFRGNLEAMTDLVLSETAIWQGAFSGVASGMEQAFGNAASLLFQDLGNLGGFVEELARGMASALIGGVAQFASAKVAENVAMAFENFAKASASAALAVTYPPAAFAAGAYTAAAKGNLVSAAKWAIVAGGASAAAGAIAGGSGGGGRGGARGDTGVNVRDASRAEPKGPDIHVYLNPFDEFNPRTQAKVGNAARLYEERYGGQMIFHKGGAS